MSLGTWLALAVVFGALPATLWFRSSEAATSPDLRELLESRVRIQAPVLGPGWHEGLLNRQRREPPCYVIVTFRPRSSSDSPLQPGVIVELRDVSRLDVYTGRISSVVHWAGRQSTDLEETSLWRPIPPSVIDAHRDCSP